MSKSKIEFSLSDRLKKQFYRRMNIKRINFNILTDVRSEILFFAFLILLSQNGCSNKMEKKEPSRLEAAKTEKSQIISALLSENAIVASSLNIFLRAFKQEQILELWGKNQNQPSFLKMKSYSFCESSGQLGPKRKEGDLQIPEGVYHINRFNEKSLFHLSLGLNYPNAADLILGDGTAPGSDIFIHGGCQTVGCIPLTDDLIKELFVIAMMAKDAHQIKIPVHIFPFQFSERNKEEHFKSHPEHIPFWKELEPIFWHFEKTKTLPAYSISPKGAYSIIE